MHPHLFTKSGDPSAPGPILGGGVHRIWATFDFSTSRRGEGGCLVNPGLDNLSEQDLMVDPPPLCSICRTSFLDFPRGDPPSTSELIGKIILHAIRTL